MKFLSHVYSAASGSIGGTTYSHNRGGMYTRARAIPTNPNTILQQARRNTLGQLSSRWGQTLTPAQRDGWEVYAQNTPQTDKLGQQLILTGQQMYVRNNAVLQAGGMTIVDDAPTTFGDATIGVSLVAFAAGSNNNITLAFDTAEEWVNTDDAKLLLFSSKPFSPARNYFRGPFQLSGSIDGDATTPPASPQTLDSQVAYTSGQGAAVMIRTALPDGRISGKNFHTGIVV